PPRRRFGRLRVPLGSRASDAPRARSTSRRAGFPARVARLLLECTRSHELHSEGASASARLPRLWQSATTPGTAKLDDFRTRMLLSIQRSLKNLAVSLTPLACGATADAGGSPGWGGPDTRFAFAGEEIRRLPNESRCGNARLDAGEVCD